MASAVQYSGPIRIEVPLAAVGGLFVSKAYRGASPDAIAEGSDADRIVSIAECLTGLLTTVEGSYAANPITIIAPSIPEIL